MSNGQAVTVKIVPVHRIGKLPHLHTLIALDMGLGFGPYILGAIKEVVWLYKYVPCYCCSNFASVKLLLPRWPLCRYWKRSFLKAHAEEEQIRNRKRNGKLA